jgi:PatG Domain
MMEPAATLEQPAKENDAPNVSTYPEARTSSPITPQAGCPSCGAQGGATDPNPDGARTISYVYAIGKVEARFPNLAAEKEFAQATGRTETAGKTDQQTFRQVRRISVAKK